MTDVRIAAAVLAALILVLCVLNPTHAWRWHSGHTLSGKFLTNATWTRPATKVLHPTGNAHRWHKWPRGFRAAIRTGFTVVVEAVLIGIALAPWPAVIVLGCLLAGGATWTGRKGYRKMRRLWPS